MALRPSSKFRLAGPNFLRGVLPTQTGTIFLADGALNVLRLQVRRKPELPEAASLRSTGRLCALHSVQSSEPRSVRALAHFVQFSLTTV